MAVAAYASVELRPRPSTPSESRVWPALSVCHASRRPSAAVPVSVHRHS
jgi:hypothetical protein